MNHFYRISALILGFLLVLITVKCEFDPAGAFFYWTERSRYDVLWFN